jgi:hypothetical protein
LLHHCITPYTTTSLHHYITTSLLMILLEFVVSCHKLCRSKNEILQNPRWPPLPPGHRSPTEIYKYLLC